jgi:hypothetical protein
MCRCIQFKENQVSYSAIKSILFLILAVSILAVPSMAAEKDDEKAKVIPPETVLAEFYKSFRDCDAKTLVGCISDAQVKAAAKAMREAMEHATEDQLKKDKLQKEGLNKLNDTEVLIKLFKAMTKSMKKQGSMLETLPVVKDSEIDGDNGDLFPTIY